MRVLIAPDKFKGSLSAGDAARAIAEGLGADHEIRILPIADGGEGTAQALCLALEGDWVTCQARDPLGRPLEAGYTVVQTDKRTAVMEMSEASGLWRVTESERLPWKATTAGTGDMIRDAMSRGAERIILGIGGSATNDGGSGMAAALGVRFLNEEAGVLEHLPAQLAAATRIDADSLPNVPEFITACDVTNPLLGPEGATRVYGPQKGVLPQQLDRFEDRLRLLADLVARDLGTDSREVPGAGAAGGLGFGTMAFLGAELRPGFDLVAELLQLEAAVQEADFVITGEGSLDAQTLHGKGPHGVALLARKHGKPVVAFAGRSDGSAGLAEAFREVRVIKPETMSVEESMQNAAELLRESAEGLVL